VDLRLVVDQTFEVADEKRNGESEGHDHENDLEQGLPQETQKKPQGFDS
jgi:hypothetical protein